MGESTSSFKIKQKIQSIRLCARTVDFHCRRTLSAGMAWASVCFALRGLKAHAIPARVAAFRSNQRCSASDYEKAKAFMELTRIKKDAVNDNLSQQMEYARLLEKENHFFCVRCIAAEAFLVLGEMRPRWDPGVRQHEEAHQPPPESEYIPFAVIERHIFREVPAESNGLQWKTTQHIRHSL